MSNTRFLYLHPYPFPELDAVRTAKAALDLPFLVKPQQARPGCGRVLTTTVPGFATDYALVRGEDAESWKWALRWAVTDEYDSRANTMAGWLSLQFGAPVVELAPERIEQRVSFQ